MNKITITVLTQANLESVLEYEEEQQSCFCFIIPDQPQEGHMNRWEVDNE